MWGAGKEPPPPKSGKIGQSRRRWPPFFIGPGCSPAMIMWWQAEWSSEPLLGFYCEARALPRGTSNGDKRGQHLISTCIKGKFTQFQVYGQNNFDKKFREEECIPIGCVPPASMATSTSTGGVFRGSPGCGVSYTPRPRGKHPPPWTQRQTSFPLCQSLVDRHLWKHNLAPNFVCGQ